MLSGRSSRTALLGLFLRLAVALALLALAFRVALPVEISGLGSALAAAWTTGLPEALAWLALACAILGASFAVGTMRFQILLRGGGLPSRWGVLLRAYLVASYFNTVLPGAILGDAYRVWDVRADTGRGSEALGLVIVERLLSLAALGSIGLLAAPAIPLADEDAYLAWILVGLSSTFLLGTVAALLPATNRLLRRASARLPTRLAAAANRALGAVAGLSRRPTLLARAFLLSLVAQALPVLAVYALAAPLDTRVAMHWYAVIVPFVTLVALVPISIGGAGLREYLYVTLFGAVGMRPDVALSLSLSVFAASLVWSAVGFALFALGRRGESRPLAPPRSDSVV